MFTRRSRRAGAALGLAVSLCWLGAPCRADDTVRLATHEQAPYGSTGPDGSFDGIAVRVVQCVFKRLGRPLKIEVYPWQRAQLLAQSGAVDGFFPATIKAERLQWASASEVIAEQKWVWYLRADSSWDPLSDTFKQHARVGAHLGSNRLKLLEEQGYQVVIRPATDDQLLKAFMKGRADAILGGDLGMAEAMREQGVNPRSLRTVVAQNSPLHAYFGLKFLQAEPEFLRRFDAQLSACR